MRDITATGPGKTETMNVPFVDLNIQYQSIREDVDVAISSVIQNSTFIGGAPVRDFEAEFAKACGVRNVVGVGNGTDAIFVALRMLGIGPGDEVITSAMSWISTSETISLTGAKPVFVDVDPVTYTIDVSLIESKITSKTRAIIPVHLYGQMSNMAVISEICKKHKLFLVEDCAQAHFSSENNTLAGRWGIAGTFSFYPGKNLGAYGDAGCIITDSDEFAAKCRRYANHGALQKHDHQIEGINSRLDTLQAAILNVKLKHIANWNTRRIENAALYNQLLKDTKDVILPKVRLNTVHTFHLFVIRTARRDELKKYLEEKGIQTSIHYPRALPNLPAYTRLGHSPGDFPVASALQSEILSLPMYPELTRKQIEYVCMEIKTFLSSEKR